MRITVTLDKDVERLLREAMHRTRQSFSSTLNNAIRAGLREVGKHGEAPFVVHASPLGLRDEIDPTGLNRLNDDLDVDAFIERATRT